MCALAVYFPKYFASVTILFYLLMGCDYPRDPNNSFNSAKAGKLSVAVIPGDSLLVQQEKAILQEFSKFHGMKINWIEMTSQKAFHELENYGVHVVVGEIRAHNPWKDRVTFTKAFEDTRVFAVAKGENKLLYQLEKFLNERL